MIRHDHALTAATPGTNLHLVSLHFGQPGSGPKVYIQGSLHADEVPGMLVAHHLRQRLAAAEAAGRLRGEVVLVPMANPIGAAQWVLRGYQGRFDLTSGENFNRQFPSLADATASAVAGRLGSDADANGRLLRAALREAAVTLPATTPLASLRRTLLTLAIDAEVVLDLHCDGEAVLHLYTTPHTWAEQGSLLARCLGAEAALLAGHSGGEPFDEACSMVWPDLAARLPAGTPLPPGTLAATIELRGEADVAHALAARDAAGIERFLTERGVLTQDTAEPLAPLPEACPATPLAGSIPLLAPHGGMVVFLRAPGVQVQAGEPLVDLIDPLSGATTTMVAPVAGHFFARDLRRFATSGMTLGKVAGSQAQRVGNLLSA